MPQKCPICLNKHTDAAQVVVAGGGFQVDCPVCGRFALSEEAWEDVLDPQTGVGHNLSDLFRAMLSHRLRTGSGDNSSNRPKVTSEFLNQLIENGSTGPAPSQQSINIIKFVGDEVSGLGEPVPTLPTEFYAIVGAPNPEYAAKLALELVHLDILSGVDVSRSDGTDLLAPITQVSSIFPAAEA